MGLLDGLFRVGEPALGLLSGAVAEPVAGWAGLLGGGAEGVQKARDAMTYQPRTQAGREGQNALARLLLDGKSAMVDNNPPVRMAVEGFNALADRAGEYNPLMGAALASVPAAIGVLGSPGTAGARNAFAEAAKGAGRSLGPTAGRMAENYMVRTGGLLSLTPEELMAKVAARNRESVALNGPRTFAPQDAALEQARINAVKMLGLPENNTPMDRARAMGFRGDWFHGSPNPEIKAFDPALAGQRGMDFGPATFATTKPANASGYSLNWDDYKKSLKGNPEIAAAEAERFALFKQIADAPDSEARAALKAQIDRTWRPEKDYYNRFQGFEIPSQGSTVYPLMLRSDGFPWVDARRQNFARVNGQAIDSARSSGAAGVRINDVADNSGAFNGLSDVAAIFDPSRIRSRFAAFDPARINSPDLLAGFMPLSMMFDQEQQKR